jgi:hypothetical protein
MSVSFFVKDKRLFSTQRENITHLSWCIIEKLAKWVYYNLQASFSMNNISVIGKILNINEKK